MQKKLPFGKYFFDIQRASPSHEQWKMIVEQAHERSIVFCRIAPDVEGCDFSHIDGVASWRTSSPSVFPEVTRVIDLTISEDEIFAQFSSTCRRHIRIARKNGVEFGVSTEYIDFADLSAITAQRDNFSAHGASYFQLFCECLSPNARMFTAEYEGVMLCAGIFVISGTTGIYYYGASGNTSRHLNAPTFLQFEAMKWAKSQGCTEFDLLGIAPDNSVNHPLAGVTQFKKKFGGVQQKTNPESILVFSQLWYGVYRIGKFGKKLLRRWR